MCECWLNWSIKNINKHQTKISLQNVFYSAFFSIYYLKMSSFTDIEIYIHAKALNYSEDTLITAVNGFCSSRETLHLNEKVVDDLLPKPIEFIRFCCERECINYVLKAAEVQKSLSNVSNLILTHKLQKFRSTWGRKETQVLTVSRAFFAGELPCDRTWRRSLRRRNAVQWRR